jgi:serine/threonine protein kinase
MSIIPCEEHPREVTETSITYSCGNNFSIKFVITPKRPEGKQTIVGSMKKGISKLLSKPDEIHSNEESILDYLFYNNTDTKVDDAYSNPNIIKYYKLLEKERTYLSGFFKDNKSNIKPFFADRFYNITLTHIFKFEFCTSTLDEFMHDTLIELETKNALGNIDTTFFNDNKNRKEGIKLDFRNQIFKGLHYLFERHIVHFDIRPTNIVVSIHESGDKIIPTYKIRYFKKAAIHKFTEKDEKLNLDTGVYLYMPTNIRHPIIYEEREINQYRSYRYPISNVVFYPMYYTTFARDLYAFFICMDLFFKRNEEETLYSYNDNNLPGGDTYKKYFDGFGKYTQEFEFQHQERVDLDTLNEEPVNDLNEEAYIKLYSEMKSDFGI